MSTDLLKVLVILTNKLKEGRTIDSFAILFSKSINMKITF